MASGNIPSKGIVGADVFAIVDARVQGSPVLVQSANVERVTNPSVGGFEITLTQPIDFLRGQIVIMPLSSPSSHEYWLLPKWIVGPDAEGVVSLLVGFRTVSDATPPVVAAAQPNSFWITVLRILP